MWRVFLLIFSITIMAACQSIVPAQSVDGIHPLATPCTADCDHTVVVMTVRDSMFFSLSNIAGATGQTLAIEFTNTSRLPHNIVIIDGDMAVATDVNRDAINQVDYLPQHPAVVATMPMVMPNQIGGIVWEPTQPGTYLFICTYPGHFDAGMYGTLTVK